MAETSAADYSVVWQPQPGPQQAFISCPVFEILYGGARGGGKTDSSLGEWAIHAGEYGDKAVGLFIRRELPQLEDAIARSKQIYGPLGATWGDQKKTWVFPNGATLRFRHLDRDSDAEKYQGHSYTRLYFEELTNFPDPSPYKKMKATLRSAHGVPCQARSTANPGGPGHHWVKDYFIDPAPSGYEVITDENGLQRVFIPAKIQDNPKLADAQPHYIAQLKQSGSPELVRAWLLGDWSVIQGAYFPEFGPQHIARPHAIPGHWLRFRAFDWGSARPFSCGWYAVSDGDVLPSGQWYPAGALIKYREWYGASEPNVGLKLTAEEVAEGIRLREVGEKIAYGVADPACNIHDGGPSIIERMLKCGVVFRTADNQRLPGWDQLRARLVGEDDRPMLYFFDTCRDTIRTLPALQHDDKKPEDVDTDGEDHAGDETRYAVMSRPYTQVKARNEPMRDETQMTFMEMVQANTRRRLRDE